MAPPAEPLPRGPRVELAVIVPTLNECDNIPPMVAALDLALKGIAWEVIFVDDDSRDGSLAVLRELGQQDPRVRFLRRVRRRGLSSACMEGMLSTPAPYLAVLDGDLQHDESLLPEMLRMIRAEKLDLVIGSRNLDPGGMGSFAASRAELSTLGAWLGRLLPGASTLTDPMSGFFLLDREFLERVLYRTSLVGFKILLDLVTSSATQVRFRELPYRFRNRREGESKLDSSVSMEFLHQVADKLVGHVVPVRFVFFVLAGVPGLALHLLSLGLLLKVGGQSFFAANVAATLLAMTLNFFVNNWFTYSDERLHGQLLLKGLLVFYAACVIGALASFSIADFLFSHATPWYLAGPFGMAVASVWNYSVTRTLAWRRPRWRPAQTSGAGL